METIQQTSKDYFKTLAILHLALVSGTLLFGIISYLLFVIDKSSNEFTEISGYFLFLVPIVFIAGLLASYLVYKNKLSSLIEINNLNEKLAYYRGAFLVRLAILEGTAFFAIVSVMLTNNIIFLLFAGLIIIIMIYYKPTRKSIIIDMQLNQQEIVIIENPDAIIG